MCSKNMRQKSPTNFILLGVLTVSMSIDVGLICLMYIVSSIINAMVMTTMIVGALTYYAFTTKRDVTIGNVFFYILAIDLFHFVIWMFFGRYEMATVLGSVCAATGFCLYLIHDVQTLMSGKRRKLDVDDYIFGALIIYMDIIQIFIKLLQLFGEKKDDDDKKNKK